MDRKGRMLLIRALIPAVVFVIAGPGASLAQQIFYVTPEPIHAYAQVWDSSTSQWIPTECNPRPEPCLIVTKGVEVQFRAIDRLVQPSWGTPDCSPPDMNPWDKDGYTDPFPLDDTVICDWDFDDGTGSVFIGSVANKQYSKSYTFQHIGRHHVKMTARDLAYYFGAYRPGADDDDVLQWFTICVVDPPEFTVENCSECSRIDSYAISYNYSANTMTLTFPNGMRAIHTYDERYRLRQVEHEYSNGTPVQGAVVNYKVDGASNRTEIWYDENPANKKNTYTYDELGRLLSATYYTGGLVQFTYDWAGNRLSAGAANYSYDDADRLISASPDYSYTYWNTGSLKEILRAQTVVNTFGYDPRELLNVVGY